MNEIDWITSVGVSTDSAPTMSGKCTRLFARICQTEPSVTWHDWP